VKLESKVVVITGGEGPLGRAVSKKFLAEGANLVIGWFAPEEWKEAKGLIADYKGKFVDMHVDATKEEQVEELMKTAKDKFGSIDILLSMAGHFHAGTMVWETDTAVFDQLIDVNLRSAFLCSKHAIRFMMEKRQGRIVFFPARFAIEPKPRFGTYAISKAGLITLVLALREELKDTDITVNAVMPDAMDTWRTRKMPNAQPDKWVKTSEVAELLCSLCSDECNIVSGSILKVFGKL
jgi:NAD(P)-dependent dehydrogenase (short-subunit alcohol dehydrogenase family)